MKPKKKIAEAELFRSLLEQILNPRRPLFASAGKIDWPILETELGRREMRWVNVDTTVQPEAVAFPADARLYYRSRERLVSADKSWSIALRQSYVRMGLARVHIAEAGRRSCKVRDLFW